MVGHAATGLLVGAQSKTERIPVDPEMSGEANHAIPVASQSPAGAGCQEKQNLPAKGKVFLLDIPFYRTRRICRLTGRSKSKSQSIELWNAHPFAKGARKDGAPGQQ